MQLFTLARLLLQELLMADMSGCFHDLENHPRKSLMQRMLLWQGMESHWNTCRSQTKRTAQRWNARKSNTFKTQNRVFEKNKIIRTFFTQIIHNLDLVTKHSFLSSEHHNRLSFVSPSRGQSFCRGKLNVIFSSKNCQTQGCSFMQQFHSPHFHQKFNFIIPFDARVLSHSFVEIILYFCGFCVIQNDVQYVWKTRKSANKLMLKICFNL